MCINSNLYDKGTDVSAHWRMGPLLYSYGIVSCEYFIHSFLCAPLINDSCVETLIVSQKHLSSIWECVRPLAGWNRCCTPISILRVLYLFLFVFARSWWFMCINANCIIMAANLSKCWRTQPSIIFL
jgi:hypothetical protein